MSSPPLDFGTSVAGLPGMNAQRVKALERLEIATVADLCAHYPRRYEDRRQFEHFPSAPGDKAVCICGTVISTANKFLRGRGRMFEAVLQESEGHALSARLTVRWFNVWFVQKLLAVGLRVVIYGKPKVSGPRLVIDHPEFEVLEETGEAETLIHLRRITPIYPATEGMSQRAIRGLIHRTLQGVDLTTAESLVPASLDKMPRGEALRAIHFPADDAERERARHHLVMTEFFGLQMLIAGRRAKMIQRPGESHCGPGKLLERFHDSLAFGLTKAQWRALGEIRGDLAAARPMNRLLQGDVGSGKTLVALSAMLLAIEAGYQTVLMAPTQVLAEQHWLVVKRWLEPLGLRLALRTGSRKEEAGGEDLFNLNAAARTGEAGDGQPDILIGTHALLFEEELAPRLGLVVIDEQHKFGVLQRAKLSQGRKAAPDVLVMTATPIPRTLAITVYGDLDISILDELPAGRGRIVTAVRPADKLVEAGDFVRAQLVEGRQAYLVYPLIEESDKTAVKAATGRLAHWRGVLAPHRVELLHGRMRPDEKDAVMRAFRDGTVHALVSTPVIEVGIDVKNANLMLIENAERFGLAQLHQLRGRIGRGEHRSYCILLVDPAASDEAREKLRTLEQSSDGFVIAEADLRLRGAGDILGTAQSGLPPLKLGDLLVDGEWMRQARQAARDLLADDPGLRRPENRRFRPSLVESGR